MSLLRQRRQISLLGPIVETRKENRSLKTPHVTLDEFFNLSEASDTPCMCLYFPYSLLCNIYFLYIMYFAVSLKDECDFKGD